VWTPTQVQRRAQDAAAKGSGLPLEQCTIHTTFLGGGFGRRLEADYVQEAAEVSKAIQGPVKVMWSREDDIKGDFYRPMGLDVVRGVISGGELIALSHRVVSASWLRRWYPPFFKNGIDPLDLTEVIDAPYAVPNFRVTYIDHEHGIPVGSWRAPNANWHGFVTESFIDELAHKAGKDPLTFRLSLLKKNPRAAGVLRLAAEKAGWGQKRAGIAQGLAVTYWAGSYAALVADVSIQDKVPKVHRVIAAIDCHELRSVGSTYREDHDRKRPLRTEQFLRLHRPAHGGCTFDRGPYRTEQCDADGGRRALHAPDRSGRWKRDIRADWSTRSHAALQRCARLTKMGGRSYSF
jgi:isoquinoline 1-oxidoreductase beta subunit